MESSESLNFLKMQAKRAIFAHCIVKRRARFSVMGKSAGSVAGGWQF
jgi:hypothetical protein